MIDRSTRLYRGLAGLLALSFAACAPAGRAEPAEPPSLGLDVPGLTAPIYQGATIAIRWHARNAPRDAEVSLWVRKVATGHLIGPIASGLSVHGQFSWRIPTMTPHIRCQIDRTRSCVGTIAPGQLYAIVARMDTIAGGSPTGIARELAPKQLIASAESAAFMLLAADRPSD